MTSMAYSHPLPTSLPNKCIHYIKVISNKTLPYSQSPGSVSSQSNLYCQSPNDKFYDQHPINQNLSPTSLSCFYHLSHSSSHHQIPFSQFILSSKEQLHKSSKSNSSSPPKMESLT